MHSDTQIYDGYKPVVCELYPTVNSMCLVRNGSFIGIVKLNSTSPGDEEHKIRMFDLNDVVIDFQMTNHIFLSMNDLQIIQDSWNQMQEMRKTTIPA